MPLTKKQKAEYLKNPNHCPYCKSDDIEGMFVDMDHNSASQKVRCHDCEKTWTDGYSLTKIFEEGE